MATFLELCQRVASDSGTVNGAFPSTVAGQTGRLGKIVRLTDDAWRQLQNAHAEWRWMQGEFDGPTVASQPRYTGNELGATRFADFVYSGYGDDRLTIYDPALGQAEEGPLLFLDWDAFYSTQLRGARPDGKPQFYTVAPDGRLALSPTPDKVYRVRGLYRKDVQPLVVDGDVPELPARYHDLIADFALILLGTHDEAPVQIPLWQMRRSEKFSNLERDQLPRITLAGAMA